MKMIRDVPLKDLLENWIFSSLITAGTWYAYSRLCADSAFRITLSGEDVKPKVLLIGALLITYAMSKGFCIGLVMLYKIFAPLSLRNRCRFEPCCSTYMILAIQKYGVAVGVLKGLYRIFRCRAPNGGVDYP